MKKKITLALSAIFAVCAIAIAACTWYHYGFVLSCGVTEHRSYTSPLTDEEKLELYDYLERTICGEGMVDFDPNL